MSGRGDRRSLYVGLDLVLDVAQRNGDSDRPSHASARAARTGDRKAACHHDNLRRVARCQPDRPASRRHALARARAVEYVGSNRVLYDVVRARPGPRSGKTAARAASPGHRSANADRGDVARFLCGDFDAARRDHLRSIYVSLDLVRYVVLRGGSAQRTGTAATRAACTGPRQAAADRKDRAAVGRGQLHRTARKGADRAAARYVGRDLVLDDRSGACACRGQRHATARATAAGE